MKLPGEHRYGAAASQSTEHRVRGSLHKQGEHAPGERKAPTVAEDRGELASDSRCFQYIARYAVGQASIDVSHAMGAEWDRTKYILIIMKVLDVLYRFAYEPSLELAICR